MFSHNKSAQTKEKRRDSKLFSEHNDKIERSNDRNLRLSQNNLSNKSVENKESEIKEKDEKANTQSKRIGNKIYVDGNFNNLRDSDEVTNATDKINKNFVKGFSSNKFDVDEYQGLSYLNNKLSPNRSDDTDVTENDNVDGNKLVKKKSVEVDFRMKYKTEICKFWELNKDCRYGNNCAFAHGIEDIRTKVNVSSNYKTKKCKQFFDTGYCPYGSRCQFLHNELRKSSTPKPNNLLNLGFVSYRKILESFVTKFLVTRHEEKETAIKSRPRLLTFTLITNNFFNNPNIHKWNSSPHFEEVEGLNNNNNTEDIISHNLSESLVNLTMDSCVSGPSSDFQDQQFYFNNNNI